MSVQLKRNELKIDLSEFDSGPVTKQQIIDDCIEAIAPGATAGKKFKFKEIHRLSDNSIVKFKILFSGVSTDDIAKIATCILELAGVLEKGVGQFPVQMLGCTDNFELYTPSGTQIDGSNSNPNVSWVLSTALGLDPLDPPTWESADDKVDEGSLAGKLLLPKGSANKEVSVQVDCIGPNGTENKNGWSCGSFERSLKWRIRSDHE